MAVLLMHSCGGHPVRCTTQGVLWFKVPQYSGDSDLFEEYCERAWDSWGGRECQTGLQVASAVQLRAGLSGAAYDAVRKLTGA